VWEEAIDRHWGRAVAAGGTWGAAMATVVTVAQSTTGGRFGLNVFSSLTESGTWLSTSALVVTSLAMGAIVFWGATQMCVLTPRGEGVALWKRYFFVSLMLALARSHIFGAFTNHYLEPFAAGCVLTGILTQEMLTPVAEDRMPFAKRLWLTTALGLSVALAVEQGWGILQSLREDTPWKQFTAHLDTVNDPILSETPYVTVRSGRQPYMIDANKFAHLQHDGKFDDAELLRKIKQGEFVAIIAETPLEAPMRPIWGFPSRWLIPMRERYYLDARYVTPERSCTFYVYRPKTQL
jgi:hypothetical protein